MSLIALAAAYDSDDSKEESEMEREVASGQDHVLPLKRRLDQVLGKEMKQEMGDGEEMVKPDSKKTKEQNPEESFNVLVPKEEPKDEFGKLEQIPGSSFDAVSIKRELKEEYSEFGREAGGVCKNEPKLELEEGEIHMKSMEDKIPKKPKKSKKEGKKLLKHNKEEKKSRRYDLQDSSEEDIFASE